MIRRVIPACFVFIFTLAVCAGAAEPKGELWILSGQSNACGRAALPGPAAHSLVTMFDPQKADFVVAQDPLPHMGTTGVGPWVATARTVVETSQQPVRMVGFASGGKSLTYWLPGQPGHKGLFPVVEKAGQKADVFLWYQGESDTGGTYTTAEYLELLQQHVARVRKAAASPDMLVVIVQLGPTLRAGRGGYMAIREAQRQFVLQDHQALLVPAMGRTLKDSVHLDNAGYQELGREIGRAILRIRHEQNAANWPGPVLDAAVVVPDLKARTRNSVVAHFAEVTELQNAIPEDFAVIDAEGTNRCTQLETGKTLLKLTFEKDIVLPARLVYGFGQRPQAALTDESGNRAPAVQLPIGRSEPPQEAVTTAANGAGTP